MLKRVVIAVATACLTTTVFAKHPDVYVMADRFEGTVKALSEPISVSNSVLHSNTYAHISVRIIATFKDGNPTGYGLAVDSVNNPATWTDCHDLAFLVDGQIFPIEATFTQEHLPDNPYVIEKWAVPLTHDAAMKFAGATKIESRVCKSEVDPFDKGDIERLRKWKAVVDDAEARGVSPTVNWEWKG